MCVKQREREIWVDAVKVFACVLVVIGHLFQSMVASKILTPNEWLAWFDRTIYCFHVPLFFLCSGYLHQKRSNTQTVGDWGQHIAKKAVTLGIPYAAFTVITWLLKVAFSGFVNNMVGNLTVVLFIRPMSPYWYLYALFCMFLITPTFANKSMAVIALGIALAMKGIHIVMGDLSIYALSKVMEYEVWFVLGMCVCVFDLPEFLSKSKAWIWLGAGFACVFLLASVWRFEIPGKGFWMGLLACTAVVVFGIILYPAQENAKLTEFMAQYTMPIFLMHTIFAAGFRSVLLQFGVSNAPVHITVGLIAGFAGPILAVNIMEKVKWFDVLLHPGKYIKFTK